MSKLLNIDNLFNPSSNIYVFPYDPDEYRGINMSYNDFVSSIQGGNLIVFMGYDSTNEAYDFYYPEHFYQSGNDNVITFIYGSTTTSANWCLIAEGDELDYGAVK